MPNKISTFQNRKAYLDFLRIISIYMVLFNHTNTKGFVLFIIAGDSPLRFFYLCNAIFIKIAVPIFLMISGALLLGKQETIRYIVEKRFFKFLCILTVASVLLYCYTCFRIDHKDLSLFYFLKELYAHSLSGAYWYIYLYLAYLLMLPFLRRLAINITENEYLWLFLMFWVVQMLSIVDFLLFKGTATHNVNFNFFITSKYIIYPFLGYYIDRKMSDKYYTRKILAVLISLSILSIVLCAVLTEYKCRMINEWSESTCQTFFSTLIFIPASTVFLGAKMWFDNHMHSKRLSFLIEQCGGLTFGIFLIEKILRHETEFVYRYLQPRIHSFPACLIWILSACILGAAITFIAKKLPLIREYI